MNVNAHQLLSHISSESLLNLLSSVHREACHTTLQNTGISPPLSSLKRGDIVEIQGPSGSGKTHLLYYFVMLCIMPISYSSVPLHGWEKVAVVYDTDVTFEVPRLYQLLLTRLGCALSSSTQVALPRLAALCLDRLHVFRPTSSLQLAATLIHLPRYLTCNSPETEMGLLIVDSCSAFYWADRLAVEHKRHSVTNTAQSLPHPVRHVISALTSIHSSYNPMVLLTNWALLPATDSSAHPIKLYKQHLEGFPLLSSVNGNATTPPRPSLTLSHRITLGELPKPPSRGDATRSRFDAMDLDLRRKLEFFAVLQIAGSKAIYFVFTISSNDIQLRGI